MSKKLASRLALLLCLLTTLAFATSENARATSECIECRQQCRADYDECRQGYDIGQCFFNYENCLDYNCGPVCGGQ